MKIISVLFLSTYLVSSEPMSISNNKLKNGRIIGGSEARAGQYPFMAALNIQTQDSTFFCGGALISNEWILTSAHCVKGAVVVIIRLGSTQLTGIDSNRVTLASSHVEVHPLFDEDVHANDVGLVKLRLPVQFGDYIQPIRLALTNLPTTASPVAIGWGQTSQGDADLANDLQYVSLAIIPNNECSSVYGNEIITNNVVCLDGNYNEGTCFGDTGSPLVVRMIGTSFLQHVGISSFFSANGCESTDPSGFIRTYPYVDWIKNITGIE